MNHATKLRGEVSSWNRWRQRNPGAKPELAGADLSLLDLRGADLRGANLIGANLYKTDLSYSDLQHAVLERAYLREVKFAGACLSGAAFTYAVGGKTSFEGSRMDTADLRFSNFESSNFSNANIPTGCFDYGTFSRSDFRGANLTNCSFNGACLDFSDLRTTILTAANFDSASLNETDLSGLNLDDINLCADLIRTNLSDSSLRRATITGMLIETNLNGAILDGCRVYGAAVWDVKTANTSQLGLIITPRDTPNITVDDLEVAQFVYLILRNEKIRTIINTVGKKGVLILGRFGNRMHILDALRSRLRELDLVPIVFDFERPTQRDFTETVTILAGLCRFIIADITNPKSSPLELHAIVPNYMIPLFPIIQGEEEPFSMFRDLRIKYRRWVQPALRYHTVPSLIDMLNARIVQPAIALSNDLAREKAQHIDVVIDAD